MHPVSVYGQDYEKEKRPGTSYQPLFELQSIFKKFPFWYDPLNMETVERKEKNDKMLSISRARRAFWGK